MPDLPAQSLNQLLQHALLHHQAGRFAEAEVIYRQILQANPDQTDALHLLGLLKYQSGNYEMATELIGQAILINPAKSLYHYNLGTVYQELHRLDEAENCFRRTLEFSPNQAEACFNLGAIYISRGKIHEAIVNFRRALSLKPGYIKAHMSLAGALHELGKVDEAIENYRHVIARNPNSLDAYNSLGNLLRTQGRLNEAVACYQKALALNPDDAETCNNLGIANWAQGFLEQAANYFRMALSLKPDSAEAYNNLGKVLQSQGELGGAVETFCKALELKPGFMQAYSNLLFLHAYHATLESDAYLSLARGWELACVPVAEREAARTRSFSRAPLNGRRLKLGYVSGDFRQHAVSYFVEQLFSAHDRTRIELFAYSASGMGDAVTDRIRAMAEHWIPVAGMSDRLLRERIEADGIDILVDLSGHTAHNRMGVFAHRAAPVQIHYLGYFASTGLSEMDYFIGDDILTPSGSERHFAEQIWRLPRIWVSYEGRANAPSPDWLPAQDGSIRLGSFNNLSKLTSETLALWAKVLHALPEGKLLLKTKALEDAGNRRRILEGMVGYGIAAERIELKDSSDTPGWAEHMACYNQLDIALDPIGAVGGGTTTCDALWMGVPVIPLEGDRMATRMTASMLAAIGHSEWIARSEVEYVDKVVGLARDVDGRRALRSGLRERMANSPLCDARDLAMKLEDAYIAMFERWRASQEFVVVS